VFRPIAIVRNKPARLLNIWSCRERDPKLVGCPLWNWKIKHCPWPQTPTVMCFSGCQSVDLPDRQNSGRWPCEPSLVDAADAISRGSFRCLATECKSSNLESQFLCSVVAYRVALQLWVTTTPANSTRTLSTHTDWNPCSVASGRRGIRHKTTLFTLAGYLGQRETYVEEGNMDL